MLVPPKHPYLEAVRRFVRMVDLDHLDVLNTMSSGHDANVFQEEAGALRTGVAIMLDKPDCPVAPLNLSRLHL